VSFTLVADKSSETRVSSSKSSANIQKTVKSFISELNKYKSDLDGLGFVDLFGNEDGVLANDFYLRNVKQQFTNFIKAPISGYGDEDVYLIELGIKTARGGSFVFDKTIFDRTFTNNPEKFDALAHDTAYASDPNISVVYSSSSNLNPGKYSYENSTQNLISSATSSSVGSLAHSGSGPFTFTSSTYPGFAFLSSSNDPSDFDIYLGRSAKTRLIDLFESTLAFSGSYSPTLDLYNDKSKQLDSKLADLEQREKILQARYTAQFSVMEELVTTSKSTGSYISQLVDGWNSKK
jgi:flagellar hook-associated protein 2